MYKYKIWYMKPEHFPQGIRGELPATDMTSHIKVKDMELASANDFDYVFWSMQGENWSPNGEAQPLLRSLGLEHISMSVGDVIEHDGNFWMVDTIGFKKLDHITWS